jgi:hypothetical protein
MPVCCSAWTSVKSNPPKSICPTSADTLATVQRLIIHFHLWREPIDGFGIYVLAALITVLIHSIPEAIAHGQGHCFLN